jgi:hypothetical protein
MLGYKYFENDYFKNSKLITITGYSLSYNNVCRLDDFMIDKLKIEPKDYYNIIITCNAVIAEDGSYIFTKEEDAEKAVMMLKMIGK